MDKTYFWTLHLSSGDFYEDLHPYDSFNDAEKGARKFLDNNPEVSAESIILEKSLPFKSYIFSVVIVPLNQNT